MTITNQTTKVSYLGNGATTVFSYNFPIDDGEEQVSLLEISSGTETVLSSAAYSITGLGTDVGGNVTYPISGAALTTAYYLIIRRVVDLTQEAVFGNQSGFYPQSVEDALDELVKQIQQVAQSVANVVQYNAVDPTITTTLPPAATRALKYLTFDAAGDPTVSSALATGVYPVSAAVGPLLNSASVAVLTAALGALLGISGATSTGSANAQAVAGSGFVLAAGSRCTFKAGFTNTGAATLNANATGAIALRKQTSGGLSPLVGGEITAGTQVDTEYDGTFHVLLKGTETLAGVMTNIASANTVNLATVGSHNANITGAVNILDFGSSALVDAPIYYLTFASNPLITHNAALIICPGNENFQAAAGDTCIAQYLGAGVWQIIEHQRKRFTLGSAPTMILRDQVASGTNGAALTSAVWNTRRLQTTVLNEITGGSLAANQITLPAGVWEIDIRAIWNSVSSTSQTWTSQTRLRNITDVTTALVGLAQVGNSLYAGGSYQANCIDSLKGRITLTGPKVFEFQHYLTCAAVPLLGGRPVTTGEVEVYAEVIIRKVLVVESTPLT